MDALWDVLLSGTDTVTEVPADRFDITAHYSPVPGTPGRTASRHGGFLNDVHGFDAAFFGVSPVEAKRMDPQQRILMQVVWEALEAAGIRPSELAGSRSGVFIGQATSEYSETGPLPGDRDVRDVAGHRVRAVTAGRLSYALDLRGPSVVLDTACSSSLVAVHAARQSLQTGESDLAIAGGVNVILSPDDAIAYSQGSMLSPRGRCRFGDADSDGFVRSEGVAAIVLKRLPDALRDGDPVLGLLLGSAVTNDGRASGLLLQPSVDGQVQMLREACRSAGITPGQLDYVEAHGTGTPVGDRVELQALGTAVSAERTSAEPLLTGSVKTNIGHTEAAAGIAGLIKAVLMTRHGLIPPSLHLENPHPLLADGTLPVQVVRGRRPLDKRGEHALVGVSSFGLSGTNAHAVIGEYVPGEAASPSAGAGPRKPRLLVLSARSKTALERLATAYADHLDAGGAGREQALDDVCATAAVRRDAHRFRLWVVGETHDDFVTRLRALAAGEHIGSGGLGDAGVTARRTVFVFPGQGSQWLGMGRGLYASSPAFRTALDACDAAVREELGWSVVQLLHDEADAFPVEVERVQPALWALEVALVAAWREHGVEPELCVGHSMGEVAAAYAAGALSLAGAASVICRRSRLMRRVAGRGAMLATELSAQEARRAIAPHGGRVCIAAENAPTGTVLAGHEKELAQVEEELGARGVFCRRVKVNVASHSPLMDEIRDDLTAELAHLSPAAPHTAMFSTVRGAAVADAELSAAYWVDNLRLPVRFSSAIAEVAQKQESVFVEVSPHPVLTTAVQETLAAEPFGVTGEVVASLYRERSEPLELVCSVGKFFTAGGRVDWSRWYPKPRPLASLPSYPWDSTEFRHPSARRVPRAAVQAPIRTDIPLSAIGGLEWGQGVSLHGIAPVPPAVHVATMLSAAAEASPGKLLRLANVELGAEVVGLDRASTTTLRVALDASDARGTRRATVVAIEPGSADAISCASAEIHERDSVQPGQGLPVIDSALGRCHRYLPAAAFEALANRQGYSIGEAFQAVDQLWCRGGEAVARMRRPKAPAPAAWECGLQPLITAWPAEGGAYVPVGFGGVELIEELPEEFWSVCTFTPKAGAGSATAEVALISTDGRLLARFSGIRMHRLRDTGRRQGAVLAPAPRILLRSATAHAGRGAQALATRLRAATTAFQAPPARAPHPSVPSPASPPSHAHSSHHSGPAAAPVGAPEARSSDSIRIRAAAVLGMSVEDLDERRPLRDYGLDSLMAAQLRLRLRSECGMDITAARLLGAESLNALEQGSGKGW